MNPGSPPRDQEQTTQGLRMKTALSLFILGLLLTAPCRAGTLATPACKRDLAQTQKSLDAALARIGHLDTLPQEEKCAAISNQGDAARAAREVWSRCHTGEEHDRSISDADDVLDEVTKTYNRVCPPRNGMVRVHMMAVERVAPRELPPRLAAAHQCDTAPTISFMNEPFDGGRIMLAGCLGRNDVSAEERKGLNASGLELASEQIRVYLTLDATGRGATRLWFPIFTADGNQMKVGTLPQSGTMPTGRNSVVANWKPDDPAICRVHAEWRVKERKAELVLWQELADCATRPPQFKTIVDRRAEK
jgi:hypothetical protein